MACFYLIELTKNKYEGLVRNLEQKEGKLSTKDIISHKNANYTVWKKYINKFENFRSNIQNNNSRVIFCFSCGGRGHIAKFCKDSKQKVAEQQQERHKRNPEENQRVAVLCAKEMRMN